METTQNEWLAVNRLAKRIADFVTDKNYDACIKLLIWTKEAIFRHAYDNHDLQTMERLTEMLKTMHRVTKADTESLKELFAENKE